MIPDDGSSPVPVSPNGLLQFRRIGLSQFGTYRCTAEATGTSQESVDIVISSKILFF